MMNKVFVMVNKGIIVLGIFVVLLWLVNTLFIYYMVRPKELKIIDLTGDRSSAEFVCPNAERFTIELGGESVEGEPNVGRLRPSFACYIEIQAANGDVWRFDVPFEKTVVCNWLSNYWCNSTYGYILNSDNSRRLSGLNPGETYKIVVVFDNKPAEVSSIWLSYMQSDSNE